MAKKLKVTPKMEEILRKANVPEEKIAELRETEIEVKELSPDELDAVSGGYQSEMGSSIMDNEDAINEFVYKIMASIEQFCGKDVVATYLDEMFHDTTITSDYKHAGLDGLYNRLGQLYVNHQFTNYDGNLFW